MVLTMPKEDTKADVDVSKLRPKQAGFARDSRDTLTAARTTTQAGEAKGHGAVGAKGSVGQGGRGQGKAGAGGEFVIREARKAVVHAMDEDDEDFIPDL